MLTPYTQYVIGVERVLNFIYLYNFTVQTDSCCAGLVKLTNHVFTELAKNTTNVYYYNYNLKVVTQKKCNWIHC